jgi:hypothetical protein
MNGRWHRDRIIGAVFVAIGVVGLLGTLAIGWAARPEISVPDRARIQAPSTDDQDRVPDWMGQMRERMQGDRPEGGMRGFGPGPGDQDPWYGTPGDGDGWMPPGQGGRGWHGQGGIPDASPSPSPSATPAPSESSSPSATPGQG